MDILITGAAGNLGTALARHLLPTQHHLRLLFHKRSVAADVAQAPRVRLFRADLGEKETLSAACEGVDAIVHFAGVLFRPWPEHFLWKTNVTYVENLTAFALASGVSKFVLISFPHVEGESSPNDPAYGRMDGNPHSLHARTRLAAEHTLFKASEGAALTAVSLRAGMIYARGVLMIEAARWLLRRRLLGIWRTPTWTHLLSLPDFNQCVQAALENTAAAGVYNLGDDRPMLLQDTLDVLAEHWGTPPPWRGPAWLFYLAGLSCELGAALLGKPSPLTRDFIRIGMASFTSDTTRMKLELVPHLRYSTLKEGLVLL